MKKKAAAKKRISINRSLGPLIEQVRTVVQSARQAAAASVNTLQVLTNFRIGRLIVEHEQQGQYRAAYGKETLVHLSASLTAEFGRGFSRANLEYMRKFYLLWQDCAVQISQKPSGKLPSAVIGQTPSGKSAAPFNLSWSHYVLLLTIKDAQERGFYEIECAQSGWSVPELKRQLNSASTSALPSAGTKNASASLRRKVTSSPDPPTCSKIPNSRIPGPGGCSRLHRDRPRIRYHRQAPALPTGTRQRVSLRGPPEALHLRRRPFFRGPGVL